GPRLVPACSGGTTRRGHPARALDRGWLQPASRGPVEEEQGRAVRHRRRAADAGSGGKPALGGRRNEDRRIANKGYGPGPHPHYPQGPVSLATPTPTYLTPFGMDFFREVKDNIREFKEKPGATPCGKEHPWRDPRGLWKRSGGRGRM